jgi:hypothetical protein
MSETTWNERKAKKEPKRKPGAEIEKAKSKVEQLQETAYSKDEKQIIESKRSRLAVIQ